MRCPKCGKEIEQDSKFCIFCGGDIRPVAEGGRKCPKCGVLNPYQEQYCSTCGASLILQPTVVKAQPTKTSPPKPLPRTCPSCGSKNDFDARFCDSCGTSLTVEKPSARCQVCGKENTSGGTYCESCGAVVSPSDGSTTAAQISDAYESDVFESNPIMKVWNPIYEKFWLGSPVARSESGFIIFLALIFVTLVLIIAAASGSWWAGFCVTGVIFLVVTLLLALGAYEATHVPEQAWGSEPVEDESYVEEDSSEE